MCSALSAADPMKDLFSEGITIDLREPFYSDLELSTQQGGVITGPGIRIQAQELLYSRKPDGLQQKRLVKAKGHVMVEYGDMLFVGESLEYDFLTRTGTIEQGRTAMYPWFFGGERIVLCANQSYYLDSAFFTTSEDVKNDWKILATKASVTDRCYLTAENLQIRAFDIPVFWIPYFKLNLDFIFDTPIRYYVSVGGRRGMRFGIQYKLFTWNNWKTYLRMDYRLFRGPGGGFEVHYKGPDNKQRFDMINYVARDNSLSDLSERFRYRFQGFYNNILLRDKVSVNLTYDKLSDKDMATDYEDMSLRFAIAERTQLTVRRQEWSWIANFIAKPRVNTFQTLKQELPTVESNIRPTVLGPTGIIMANDFRASYLDFDYTNKLTNVSDYSSLRLEYNTNLYRPFHFGFLTATPEAGGVSIYYQNTPERKPQLLALGLLGAEVNTSLYRKFFDYKHVVKPYIKYSYYTFPTSKPDQHYIFDIEDGWFRLNTTRFGFLHNLYAKQENGCINRFLSADFYAYAFIDTPTIERVVPRLYSDIIYQLSPFIKHTVQFAWDYQRKQIAHLNVLMEWTLDETCAVAAEYRHRNAYDWRKVEYFNFILDSFRTERELRRSSLSDRRDTLLVHLYYQFHPSWALEVTSRQGWNRSFEPSYFEYEIDIYGTIRSAWNLRFTLQHRENDKRAAISFSTSLGMKRPNESKFRCTPPCADF